MIAMTTNNSISVKPLRQTFRLLSARMDTKAFSPPRGKSQSSIAHAWIGGVSILRNWALRHSTQSCHAADLPAPIAAYLTEVGRKWKRGRPITRRELLGRFGRAGQSSAAARLNVNTGAHGVTRLPAQRNLFDRVTEESAVRAGLAKLATSG